MNFNSIRAMKAAAILAVAFIAFHCGAMPALPRPVMINDGRGGFVEVMVHGDERAHVITTTDGATLLRRDVSGRLVSAGSFDAGELRADQCLRSPQKRLSSGNTFPCFGSQRALAILVEFPETSQHPDGRRFISDDPRSLFESLLNDDNYSHDGATGSVRSYFLDNSNGVLDLSFDVFGPVTLSHDVKYYIESEVNAWHMVEEACSAIDAMVDFTDYDRDFDGVIDNVYIFYAGQGGATGGDPSDCIWQHAADVENLSGQKILFDGVRLNHYACSNEYRYVKDAQTGVMRRQTEGIGTVCHEFSHVLGLPDLYDVFYSGNRSPGLWDVMDTGCHLNDSRTPAAYSALDRMLLGWLEPETIGDAPRTLSLRSIDSNQAFRISTADPNEYFLLENRQQTGWDTALPGHGMLVWRINYQSDFWDANQVNTGRGKSHAFIVCADGLSGEDSAAGDPFPGASRVTGLSDDGYPNMLSSAGERTNVPLSGITEAAGIVSFDVCRAITSLEKVRGLDVAELTPTSFLARWEAIPLSPGYVVNVTDASGEPVGIYKDLNVTETSLCVTGLEPESLYSFTVYGLAGAVRGDVSDPFAVTTPAMSFAFTAPAALDADEVGESGFHARWEELEGAVDYVLTVMTVTEGEPRHAAVDFTGGIEALPAGWSTNCISTMSINGYYGHAAPALSMGADYARLQSPLLSHSILSFEFWYRERTPSGMSSLGIEMLCGGEWLETDRVELPAVMPSGMVYKVDADMIPDGAIAVRLIYHREQKGTLTIDDVKLSYRGDGRNTPLDGWNGRYLGSAATDAVVDGLEPSTEYYWYVCGIDADGTLSAPSEPIRVTTGDPSALGTVIYDSDGEIRLYDLWGRPVDGATPSPGIYILKNNTETKKLIYR